MEWPERQITRTTWSVLVPWRTARVLSVALPVWEVAGGLGLAGRPGGGWTARLDARWTGEQFAIDPATGGDSRLAPSLRLDLSATRALGRGLEATVSVSNLSDTACLDQVGLPQPGRAFGLLLQARRL